jgi:enoyl-[acyl-carrier-protein] reductase (NADH)
MHREGADIAFTFQNEKLQSRVEKMAAECNSNITIEFERLLAKPTIRTRLPCIKPIFISPVSVISLFNSLSIYELFT